MFLINWKIFIEISLLVLFFIGSIIVASVLLGRSIIYSYKEVYKYHSKFDIELRKVLNLISKVIKNDELEKCADQNTKDLPMDKKRRIVTLVDELVMQIDPRENEYIHETYENLHEIRRIRDGQALIFNQKIMMFPFNVLAKIMKLKKWEIYTEKQ